VHFGAGRLRASVHGEREAAAGGPVAYQIGQAVEAAFKGNTTLSLAGDSLSVISSRGTLRYITVAPPVAPTGTIAMRVQATILGKARAVAATLTAYDADELELWQWAAPASGATLGYLATGSYTITATTTGATCSPATMSVTSGQTVAATVVCRS
jgi:hypothetical protein